MLICALLLALDNSGLSPDCLLRIFHYSLYLVVLIKKCLLYHGQSVDNLFFKKTKVFLELDQSCTASRQIIYPREVFTLLSLICLASLQSTEA